MWAEDIRGGKGENREKLERSEPAGKTLFPAFAGNSGSRAALRPAPKPGLTGFPGHSKIGILYHCGIPGSFLVLYGDSPAVCRFVFNEIYEFIIIEEEDQ